MKKILFVANDPGGYDVINPLFERFSKINKLETAIMLTGKAAEKAEKEEKTIDDIKRELQKNTNCIKDVLLVTGTSWNSEIEVNAIRYCKTNNIKTVSILDYWSNYKERFKLGEDYEFPDYYFVMDEMAASEAEDDGINKSIIRVVGTPGLDYFINKKIEVNQNGNVVFLSQPLSVIYGNNLGYTEYEAFEQVIKACEKLKFKVHIKFHPKDDELFKEKYKAYSIEGDLKNLCELNEYIVGMSTMGLLQCALMGAKVISFQPGLIKKDMSIVNKLGITKGAFSYSDLISRLQKDGKEVMKNKPFWMDGNSIERCVKEIEKIISN